MTVWKEIQGYKNPYRINENGVVQQFSRGKWVDLSIEVNHRAEVRLRGHDGKQKRVGIFRLLDRCFFGGYADKNKLTVGPRNGIKTECTLENLQHRTQSSVGAASLARSKRRAVVRHDRNGKQVIYKSVSEAARKNGLTPAALDRRLYHGVLDPRGYRWEILT